MTNHRNEMKTEIKEDLRGGKGPVHFTYLADIANEKNLSMFAEVSLAPGSSIGYHIHETNAEYYIILSGSGIVNDNGVETQVKTGDSIITKEGAGHSITNTGNVPLVFHAIIVNN